MCKRIAKIPIIIRKWLYKSLLRQLRGGSLFITALWPKCFMVCSLCNAATISACPLATIKGLRTVRLREQTTRSSPTMSRHNLWYVWAKNENRWQDLSHCRTSLTIRLNMKHLQISSKNISSFARSWVTNECP